MTDKGPQCTSRRAIILRLPMFLVSPHQKARRPAPQTNLRSLHKLDPAPGIDDRANYSRLKPARNRPSTSSVAASKARRGIEPVPTRSAPSSGTSSTTNSPLHTFILPTFCLFRPVDRPVHE